MRRVIRRWQLCLLLLTFISVQLYGKYEYECSPLAGDYISSGKRGTTTTLAISINYSDNTYKGVHTPYDNGVIKSTIWGHDTDTGVITFRVMKDDGTRYFNANTKGKLFVYYVGQDKLYPPKSEFSITNSTTDHVDVSVTVGNFQGLRSYQIIMIKADGQKFYGGEIRITGTGIFKPTATTNDPTDIDATSAVFHGHVAANGAETTCYFIPNRSLD